MKRNKWRRRAEKFQKRVIVLEEVLLEIEDMAYTHSEKHSARQSILAKCGEALKGKIND